jgi:hypothetical protein
MKSNQRIVEFRVCRWLRCGVLALALTMLYGADSTPVFAQAAPAAGAPKYQQLDAIASVRNDASMKRSVETKVAGVLRGDLPLSELTNQSQFDGYYTRYLFPMMTQLNALNEIPKHRAKLLNDLLNTKSEEAHQRLIEMTRVQMQAIARGNFHPAARVNAMLIIGELNSNEAVQIGNSRPPEPYLKALGTMLEEFSEPTQIDAVRAAALVGILRHAEMDGQRPEPQRIRLDVRYMVIAKMLELIRAKTPPTDRTPEGHVWMQRRAIEVLGALRDVGANDSIITDMAGIVADDAAPMSLRCTAAVCLGRLDFLKKKNDLDVPAVVSSLADLAAEACHKELTRLEDEVKKKADAAAERSGSPGGYGEGFPRGVPEPGGLPGIPTAGGPSKLEYFQIDVARRRLKYQLVSAQMGLAGPDRRDGAFQNLAKPGAEKDFANKVADSMNTLIAVMDKPDLDVDKFVNEVRTKVGDLETVLNTSPWPRKPKSADPATDPSDTPTADIPSADVPGGLPAPAVPAPAVPAPAVPAVPN